jgi:hypothetical protein
MDQSQRENHEMKRLLKLKIALLTMAAIAGCGSPPSLQEMESAPLQVNGSPSAVALSCVERSAAARPPKHPIVELAWCIAETDELFDPDHLFHDTLGIEKYTTSEGITWGLKTGGDPNQNVKLPKGIRYFSFLRKIPKANSELGKRDFSIQLESKNSCVRMSDVMATFGADSWLTAVPIAIPSPATAVGSPSFVKRESNPYGIFYKSPRLFMRDASGSVSFFFRNEECVEYISLQRDLNSNESLKFQGGSK